MWRRMKEQVFQLIGSFDRAFQPVKEVSMAWLYFLEFSNSRSGPLVESRDAWILSQ